ncbi:MAG: ATP-binding protein [Myxococcales bacterium]|nr:ATP-binding protein [Myxococcales bacterium]
MVEVIEQIVADALARPLPDATQRRVVLPALPGKVDAVVGMRRSGKTWLLFETMKRLLAAGVPRERMLYVNFEDDRLLPLDVTQLRLFPEAFYRRVPAASAAECWFFYDEIQRVPGWETFVRRQLDTPGVRLTVTGSSAKLLSREIATSMRGRSLTTEVLPFGFDEALRHQGIDVPERWPPPTSEAAALAHAFERYLEVGGFPEVQGLDQVTRLRIVQDYIDVALLRDVVERHGVTNVEALRWLVRHLLSAPAGRFSINRFFNDLKSQGLAVGKDTLHAYLRFLEDAFVLFTVPIWTPSERVRRVNPRKAYPADPALARAMTMRPDTGHLLETLVFLELRRRGFDVGYLTTESGYEVDFMARHLDGRTAMVQVCARLDEPETRRRELRALEEALTTHAVDEAAVVTLHETETLTLSGHDVRVWPAWRWLLEGR